MGGNNETKISGLRFHENSGMVHIHDDSKSLKFSSKVGDFKTQVKSAFESLKDNEGIVKIEGSSSDTLCLCKMGRSVNAFLLGSKSVKTDIESFARSL